MARPPSKEPTAGELAILRVLWDAGPLELGTIRAGLGPGRGVAPSTVATMLKVMLDKGLVVREDGPKGYVWKANISLDAARSGLLDRIKEVLFEGSAHRLVAHVVERGELSDEDRAAIRKLLDAKRRKSGGPKT